VLSSLLEANLVNLTASLQPKRLPKNLTPPISTVRWNLGTIYDDGCILTGEATDPGERDCVYGDPQSAVRVALVGDSHAAQWFPALEALAETHRWRLRVFTKTSCTPGRLQGINARGEKSGCEEWQQNVFRSLEEERPDAIVTATYRYELREPAVATARAEDWAAALGTLFARLRTLSPEVLFIEPVPRSPKHIPNCVLDNERDVSRCNFPRSRGTQPTLSGIEEQAATTAGVRHVPTGDWFCTDQTCVAILGNILVYADNNHITNEIARYFRPFLEAALLPVLRSR
jgi:hypothetical protein